jgi:hypothetical protein
MQTDRSSDRWNHIVFVQLTGAENELTLLLLFRSPKIWPADTSVSGGVRIPRSRKLIGVLKYPTRFLLFEGGGVSMDDTKIGWAISWCCGVAGILSGSIRTVGTTLTSVSI